MSGKRVPVAVIGAGGKMGMRVSANLEKAAYDIRFVEAGEAGRQRVEEAGRTIKPLEEALCGAQVVIMAVPDRALGDISQSLLPQLDRGTIVLTLDPAAAYAGLLAERDDIYYGVAHPCHPSIFYPRTSQAEWADTFGGIACPMDVVGAFEYDDGDERDVLEQVIRDMYSPVIKVHWVTVKQLAQLEPTLAETVACMVGSFLKDALRETVDALGVPEEAAKAMFYGHIQVALANGLEGDNPFSDACLIAMDYGRKMIVKDDWKKIFHDDELDANLQRMLGLDESIKR